MFDDFQEITPGSLAQLETFLNDTGIREVPNRTPNSHERGFPAPVAESLSNQSVQTFQTARSDSNLSPHGNEPLAEGLRHRGRGASKARQKTVPASAKFWILPLFQYQVSHLEATVPHLKIFQDTGCQRNVLPSQMLPERENADSEVYYSDTGLRSSIFTWTLECRTKRFSKLLKLNTLKKPAEFVDSSPCVVSKRYRTSKYVVINPLASMGCALPRKSCRYPIIG